MSYTTAEIQLRIQQLEANLNGVVEVEFQGRRVRYGTPEAIRNAIAYYTGLLPDAVDAQVTVKRPIRTLFFSGNKGFTA